MKILKKVMLGLFALSMLMCISFASVSAKADEATSEIAVSNQEDAANVNQGSEGLTYTLSSDGTYYSVSKGSCTDKNVVISSMYNDLPVKRIPSDGFKGYSSLTSVVIPDRATLPSLHPQNNYCTL